MNKKAFTLVELIVVITILAVLATVAFISFQGYAASSRDSVRLSDLRSMEKVINLYKLTNSKYPIPNSSTGITYSGSLAWTQGVFGDNSYTKNTNLSDIPTDPVTKLAYSYAVTNTKQQYQIAAVLEGEPVSIQNNTYAGDQIANIFVRGDYNGKFLKVSSGSIDFILGVPSIIASDIISVDVMDIVSNKRLVYKGYTNLPASYSGSKYNTTPINGFDFTPNQFVLFEGDIKILEDNQAERVNFLNNLQSNYTGSEIASQASITEMLAVNSSSPSEANNYVANVLNNNLKTKIKIVEETINTATIKKNVSNCTFKGELIYGTISGTDIDITCGDDIIICENIGIGYSISACNIGSNIVGTGSQSNGKYFQWGEMYGWNEGNGEGPTDNVKFENGVMVPGDNLVSWNNSVSDNQDGGVDRWYGDNTPPKHGPCKIGYHVPSEDEWMSIINAGDGVLWDYQSWNIEGLLMSNLLKMPKESGQKEFGVMTNGGEGGYGYYQTSTPDTNNSVYLGLADYFISIGNHRRSNGYSVRCIKD